MKWRSSGAGAPGSKSFLWKLRLRSREYSSVGKKFQPPSRVEYERRSALCTRVCREARGGEGKNREARRQRMETERLIDLVVTLRLTSIFESVFFLVPLDELAVIQSGSPF